MFGSFTLAWLGFMLSTGCTAPKSDDSGDTSTDDTGDSGDSGTLAGFYDIFNAPSDSSPWEVMPELGTCIAGLSLPAGVEDEEFLGSLGILAAKLVNLGLMVATQDAYDELCQRLYNTLLTDYPAGPQPAPNPPKNCPEEFTSPLFNITTHDQANFPELEDFEKLTDAMDATQLIVEAAQGTAVEGCWVALELADSSTTDNTIWYAMMYAAYHFETASLLEFSSSAGEGVTSVYGMEFQVNGTPVAVSDFEAFFGDTDLSSPTEPLEIQIIKVEFGDSLGQHTSLPDTPIVAGSAPACASGQSGSAHPFDLCSGSDPNSLIDPANQRDVEQLTAFTEWAIIAEVEGLVTLSFPQ